MTAPKQPVGLAAGGRALWRDITANHPDLDPQQLVQLTEACRAKDRLDKKTDRELTYFEDFRTARIRQSDGTYSTFQGGKLIAKEDVPAPLTKFHQATPVSTIVAEPEKEKVCHVRKNFDVNAQAMKL